MKKTVTKLEVARKQIEAAIELLFLGGESVSVHTLTMAGFGVLKDIAKKRGYP